MSQLILKNTAGQTVTVIAFDSSGRVSGDAANITCTLGKDGGAQVALSDVNPVEIGTTGYYNFALTQAETNADNFSFIAESATAGVMVLIVGGGSFGSALSASAPSAASADNLSVIYIGDDYVSGNGRQIYADVTPGYTPVSCRFGGAGRGGSWLVNGTIVSLGGGSFRAAFDLDATDTAGLGAGDYTVSIEIVDTNDEEHTILQKDIPVRRKQT